MIELTFTNIAYDLLSTVELEKKLPINQKKASKSGGMMDSLSNFLGTLGKKKGKNIKKALVEFDSFDNDPDASISGMCGHGTCCVG